MPKGYRKDGKTIGDDLKGRTAWNKGQKRVVTWGKNLSKALKGRKMTPEWRKKMSEAQKRRYLNGRTKEHSKNISLGKIGKPNLSRRGKNSNWWRGGVTTEDRKRLTSTIWERLRLKIIERDGRRCNICGIFPERIEVHHIVPWRLSHDDSEENLMAVCPKCHRHLERGWKGE